MARTKNLFIKMIKTYLPILRKILILADMIIVACAFFATYFLYTLITGAEVFDNYFVFLALEIIVWWLLLYKEGSYDSFRTKEVMDVFYIVFKSAFFGLLSLSALLFFLKIPQASRDFVAFSFLMSTLFLCLHKVMLVRMFRYLRKNNFNTRNLLIVGANKRSRQFIDLVKKNTEWGLKIVGVVDASKESVGDQINGETIMGTFKDVPNIIHTRVIDEVVFIVPRLWLDKIIDIVSFCETEGVASSIALDFFDLKIAKSRQVDLQGFPLIMYETTSSCFRMLLMKRIFDAVISFSVLIIFLPLFIFTALLIKLTSPGPVFFRQKRKGLRGRTFTLYKFRTMAADAESRLENLKHLNEMAGPVFKICDDPRLTRSGKTLRKLSIDELPQLWNVLRGDMSMVGPRPPLPHEVDQYDSWHRRRLSMRPGITCLWQVNGRNEITDFKKWVELDLKYIDNWSLLLDLKIFLKTIPVVLSCKGAK
jgi:exopolysaccharide biosynthesis polyprenyl glycosylphosphotransferase